MNDQLRADITTVARIALEHTKVNTAEFGVILRVVEAIKSQPTTPEPAGETVRVRAGVWAEADGSGWKVQGWHNWEPLHSISEPIAIIEADIPLPRIPTVAARVVEDQS
jgi:hypothetical protein